MIDKNKRFDISNEHLYSNHRGTFYLSDKMGQLYHDRICREEFGWIFKKETEYIAFNGKRNSTKSFNQLIDYIEKRLNLKEKTVIYRTKSSSLFVIKVPLFWRVFGYRRQLFTLFLRCGAIHNHDMKIKDSKTLKTVFKRYHLTKLIINPLFHFISGNVRMRKAHLGYGIVDRFVYSKHAALSWKKQFINR